jgi:hypothetical protein
MGKTTRTGELGSFVHKHPGIPKICGFLRWEEDMFVFRANCKFARVSCFCLVITLDV